MNQLYVPEGPGDPHAEREEESNAEMWLDLAISRGMMKATLPGSQLHNLHKARASYLEKILYPQAVDKNDEIGLL